MEDETINRGNIDRILGVIEERYLAEEKRKVASIRLDKSPNKSNTKVVSVPVIDEKDLKAVQSMELMSY